MLWDTNLSLVNLDWQYRGSTTLITLILFQIFTIYWDKSNLFSKEFKVGIRVSEGVTMEKCLWLLSTLIWCWQRVVFYLVINSVKGRGAVMLVLRLGNVMKDDICDRILSTCLGLSGWEMSALWKLSSALDMIKPFKSQPFSLPHPPPSLLSLHLLFYLSCFVRWQKYNSFLSSYYKPPFLFYYMFHNP